MKLNELIKHLKNFEDKGYEDYEVSVKNSAGQCVPCTLFTKNYPRKPTTFRGGMNWN